MSRILTQIIATRVPHDALPPLHCLAGRGQVAAGHGGGVLGLAHLGLLGPKVAAEEGRTAEGGAEAFLVVRDHRTVEAELRADCWTALKRVLGPLLAIVA